METLQVRTNVISFHGDEQIKQKYLTRVRNHRLADQIVQGVYWEDGKGCAVGCTVHSSNHWAYQDELGIPNQLAYVQEFLFENMSNADAKMFPERFLRAIPVGVDLYPAFWKFVLFALLDEKNGLSSLGNHRDADTRQVADFYEMALDGREISQDAYLELKYELDLSSTSRAFLDALDPHDPSMVTYAREALFELAYRETTETVIDDTVELYEARERNPFVNALALIWAEKLLEIFTLLPESEVLEETVRVEGNTVENTRAEPVRYYIPVLN